MEEFKAVAIEAAKKAGEFLQEQFNNFDRSQTQFKSNKEVVSEADLKSEQIILAEIKQHFPEHAILSEESGSNDAQSPYLWVVDPLDGSTNFTMHNPLWSISIGLAKDGEIVLGVVYVPMAKELFVAVKGEGVTLNGKAIKVSKVKSEVAIHAFCHAGGIENADKAMEYASLQKKSSIDCRQMGSAAIECGFVAAGRIESIVIPGAKPWDVAAGVLLVSEAGGRVSDFTGKSWSIGSPNEIIASNGVVHEDILHVMNKQACTL